MLSTLDIISNGRVELGIGAGWYEHEYIAYGYYFPSNVSRIKQLDESLSIIKTMWKEKRVSFEGKYYRIKEAICNPKPIQKPHPIIMIGRSGEKYSAQGRSKACRQIQPFLWYSQRNGNKNFPFKRHCKSIGRDDKELQYSIVLPCILKGTDQEVNQGPIIQKKR